MGLLGLVFCVFFKGRIMSVRAEMLQMPVPGMKKTPVLRGVLQGNMSLSCNILIQENFCIFLQNPEKTAGQVSNLSNVTVRVTDVTNKG